VNPQDCVVIGDIAADLGAAAAAGARAVLVPTEMTRAEEIADARREASVAPDLLSAVELVLTGTLPGLRPSDRPGLDRPTVDRSTVGRSAVDTAA
jgi:hypothetical protein